MIISPKSKELLTVSIERTVPLISVNSIIPLAEIGDTLDTVAPEFIL